MGIGLFSLDPVRKGDRAVQEPSATLLLTPGRVEREDAVVGRALLLDKTLPSDGLGPSVSVHG